MQKRGQKRFFANHLFGQLSLRRNRLFRIYLILYVLMVLLPFTFLLGYYYPASRQIIVDNQSAAGTRDVEQIKVNMDSQLRNIYNLPNVLFNHQNLLSYDLSTSVYSRYEAKYELYKLIRTNSFIDEMLLYIQDIEQFIGPTGHGSFHISQLQSASKVYGVHFSDWDYDNMRATLNTLSENQIHIFKDLTIDSFKYDEAVCFLMPLTPTIYNYAVVMVFVGTEQLAQIGGHLSMADEREIVFFDDDGMLVYDTLHRSARDIQAIMDAQSEGTGYVILSDGKYLYSSTKSEFFGWRYVSLLSYETTMADMKVLNRNSVMLVIAALLVSVALIWTTMQRTYRPIRVLSGLSNSVLNTLPLSEQDVRRDEMETVSDALAGLQQYSQQLSTRLNDARPMMRDYLIGSVLQNSVHDAVDAEKDFIRFGIYLTAPYRAACLRYGSDDEREQAHGMLNELMDEDVQLCAIYGQYPKELILLISGCADAKRLYELLGGCQPYRQLALGEAVDELADVSISYHQALEVMEELRLRDSAGQHMEYAVKDRKANPSGASARYPLELMSLLETALLHVDTEAVQEAVQRVNALMDGETLPPRYVRNIYMNTVSMIGAALSQQHVAEAFDLGKLCSADTLSQMTCQEMILSLQSITAKYIECCSKQNGLSRPIQKAVDYISRHLSDVSLSLLSVADYLKLSPSNLSRSFKSEMGKGFKEYVDLMRLEEAKQLLRETQMSIECVAGKVGYENASSFSRRFRAMRGISPSEYRTLRNGNNGNNKS